MSRSRNIKPGIMENEVLSELEPFARLLFIYLWMLADREGRLEDRPKKIKAKAFPYDNVDINSLLEALSTHGFLMRYEVEGKNYIQIENFLKHQKPHTNEAESEFPECQDKNKDAKLATKVASPCHQGSKSLSPRSKALGPCISDCLIPCISDSLVNIPDGMFVNSAAVDAAEITPESQQKKPKPSCPHQEIIGLYHEILPSNPAIRRWTETRERHLRARWAEEPERQNLQWWQGFFDHIAKSKFLTGRVQNPGSRRVWIPGLDWMCKSENFVKICEGRYDNDDD